MYTILVADMTHPVPKAFELFERIFQFVAQAALDGRLARNHEVAIGEAGVRVFRDAGVMGRLDPNDPAHRAVARHAVDVMRATLMDLRPDLASDLAVALGDRGGRRGGG